MSGAAAAVTSSYPSAAERSDRRRPVTAHFRRSATSTPVVRTLLLHGLGSSGSVWDGITPLLPAQLELWDADLPWGSEGDAAWASDPDIHRWVADALASVGDVQVVVAHSFGANALLELVDRQGGCGISAAVFVSPFFRAHADDFDWDTISYFLNHFDRIIEEGVRLRGGGRLSSEMSHELAVRVRNRIGPYGWIRFFGTYLRTPELTIGPVAPHVQVVAGERDIAAFPADSRALARTIPGCALDVLADCGHFAMVESPGEFAAILERFLSSVLPSLSDGRSSDSRPSTEERR